MLLIRDSKQAKNINIQCEIINLLEENTGKISSALILLMIY